MKRVIYNILFSQDKNNKDWIVIVLYCIVLYYKIIANTKII